MIAIVGHIADTDMRLLAIDLCCGLRGWTRGLIEIGFNVVGFDIDYFAEYRSIGVAGHQD
jgi:hypothetical protein